MRDDLPHAMRETARQLEPDVVRLAAGGVSRGTRMRRVERVVQVLGSVLAVAVVFAGAVLIGSHRPPGTPSGTAPDLGAGDGTSTADGDRTGDGARTRDGATPPVDLHTVRTPSSTGVPQISANQLMSTLKSSLLGTGVTGESYLARGTDLLTPTNLMPMSSLVVSARFSAQHDIGSISIVISGSRDFVSLQGVPETRGDGSLVYVSQLPANSSGPQDNRITLAVTLVRTDGSTLSAIETNSADEKSAAAPGAPLLLTADQVTTLLDSPVWDDAVAAAEAMPRSAG